MGVEVLRSKLFDRVDERPFELAANAQKRIEAAEKEVVERGGGCTSTFRAALGCNISAKKCTSKAIMDDSGLVGAVCFHGVGLIFLNTHGTGEHITHAIALLEEIL